MKTIWYTWSLLSFQVQGFGLLNFVIDLRFWSYFEDNYDDKDDGNEDDNDNSNNEDCWRGGLGIVHLPCWWFSFCLLVYRMLFVNVIFRVIMFVAVTTRTLGHFRYWMISCMDGLVCNYRDKFISIKLRNWSSFVNIVEIAFCTAGSSGWIFSTKAWKEPELLVTKPSWYTRVHVNVWHETCHCHQYHGYCPCPVELCRGTEDLK